MKQWYEITNRINQAIDIELHNEIGIGGITAADFINELKTHRSAKTINLSIHSPGGNMLDGFAIYNALKAHPAKVHSHVTGIAASAATTVLMAGDVISMPEDAFIMIHNPSGFAGGDSEEMRQVADVMDKLKASAVNIYAKKTGQSTEQISEMMDDETWMNSIDAMNHGFIDTVTRPIGVSNKLVTFNKYFKSMPFNDSSINQRVDKIESAYQYEQFLVECGLSHEDARTAINKLKEVVKNTPNNNGLEEISLMLNRLNNSLTSFLRN